MCEGEKRAPVLADSSHGKTRHSSSTWSGVDTSLLRLDGADDVGDLTSPNQKGGSSILEMGVGPAEPVRHNLSLEPPIKHLHH